MLINEKIIVTWQNANKKWYESKGYVFTKIGDDFEISSCDLTKGSRVLVTIKCDYCGEESKKPHKYHTKIFDGIVHKDCCEKCSPLKLKEVFLAKYGVENINQLPETNQKKVDTCRANYGVDYPGQSKEVTERMKQSRIENLGVPWAMQNNKVKRKAKKSLHENGTSPCSKQQKYLHYLLGGQLNYPVDNCNVDILLKDNIILEYNGGGHDKNVQVGVISQKDFDNKERQRDYFLKSQGYKIIKIISPRDWLPSDALIIKLINEAIKYMEENNRNHYNITFSHLVNDPIYGKLRKITKKDIEEIERINKILTEQNAENLMKDFKEVVNE